VGCGVTPSPILTRAAAAADAAAAAAGYSRASIRQCKSRCVVAAVSRPPVLQCCVHTRRGDVLDDSSRNQPSANVARAASARVIISGYTHDDRRKHTSFRRSRQRDERVLTKFNFVTVERSPYHYVDNVLLATLCVRASDSHWRRQLWGTGARAPPRLPASYFGDHSL